MYLEGSLGMSVADQELPYSARGSYEGGILKSTSYWVSPNVGATNSTKFNGIPGGHRDINGVYLFLGSIGYCWSLTENSLILSWERRLYNDNSIIHRYNVNKSNGFSIRCLKD
jgi:uncharacterized protein (TIGR02145 family)